MVSNTLIWLFITIFIILIGIIIVLASYAIYSHGVKTQDSLMIQLEAAKAKKNNHIINMSYNDLFSIVDRLCEFHANMALITSSLSSKDSSKLSILLDDVIVNVCTATRLSMSDDLIEAIHFYVSDTYLMEYIKNTVRLRLILKIGPVVTGSAEASDTGGRSTAGKPTAKRDD